jgi:hypothetical protein
MKRKFVMQETRTRRWFFFRRTRGLRKWAKFIGRKRTHNTGFSAASNFFNRPSSLLVQTNFSRSFEEARYLVRWGFMTVDGVISRDRVSPKITSHLMMLYPKFAMNHFKNILCVLHGLNEKYKSASDLPERANLLRNWIVRYGGKTNSVGFSRVRFLTSPASEVDRIRDTIRKRVFQWITKDEGSLSLQQFKKQKAIHLLKTNLPYSELNRIGKNIQKQALKDYLNLTKMYKFAPKWQWDSLKKRDPFHFFLFRRLTGKLDLKNKRLFQIWCHIFREHATLSNRPLERKNRRVNVFSISGDYHYKHNDPISLRTIWYRRLAFKSISLLKLRESYSTNDLFRFFLKSSKKRRIDNTNFNSNKRFN